jgi:hypothetical protein
MVKRKEKKIAIRGALPNSKGSTLLFLTRVLRFSKKYKKKC